MTHLNDPHPLYRDGSIGGVWGLPLNLVPSKREYIGHIEGIVDAPNIIKIVSDQHGNIKETIKIITHSMGAAYAKGYVKALLEYLKKMGIPLNIIEFEADFAPFQPGAQKASSAITTYQFSHSDDKVAGNDKIEGAEQRDTSNDQNQDHAISTFLDQVTKLPQGNYRYQNGKFVAY